MKFFKAAILLMIASIPAFSQSDMEYAISRHKSNKIVLLGEWSADDSTKWKDIIDSQEIYDHGFALLGRHSFSGEERLFYGIKNIDAFEGWLRQRYGLSARARWLALDNKNSLLFFGIQTPEPKEFDRLLDAKGMKTPLKKVRDFLRENPGHLDAMADLLKEARRRALRQTPDSAGNLDDETDLRTWGVMAAETDKVFSGPWLGVDISFFRLGKDVPERRSKLMRTVFRKHISKVESAIRLAPTIKPLWNIWVWMASGIGDYKWEKFIDGFEPIIFHVASGPPSPSISVPSVEACAWLVQEASIRKEWSIVIRLAKVARQPVAYELNSKSEWLPGNSGTTSFSIMLPKGHPVKTVYAPHIEALLRLGNIDEANNVYDRMIRIEGAENVAVIADVARSLGMEDLAQIWGRGEQVNPTPSIVFKWRETFDGKTSMLISSDKFYEYFNDLRRYLFVLSLNINTIILANINNTIGWREDEPRWALISDDNSILYQDSSIPSLDEFQAILNRFNIKSLYERYRKYIKDNGSSPGIELSLAFMNIDNIMRAAYAEKDNSRIEAFALEATRYLNRVMMDNPEMLVYLPDVSNGNLINALITPLAKPLLSNIESLLEKKPLAANLWMQWIFWRRVEGQNRSLESMVERVKPSPLSDNGILDLPWTVIGTYMEDCKKNGSWHKVAALLKTVWDREYTRLIDKNTKGWVLPYEKDTFGDVLGVPLIEAYLQDGKPGEADEIFKAVLDFGGNFKNPTKIIELAKAKGNESLATRWQAAIKQSQ